MLPTPDAVLEPPDAVAATPFAESLVPLAALKAPTAVLLVPLAALKAPTAVLLKPEALARLPKALASPPGPPSALALAPQAVAVTNPLSEAPAAKPGRGPAPVIEFPQVNAVAGAGKNATPVATTAARTREPGASPRGTLLVGDATRTKRRLLRSDGEPSFDEGKRMSIFPPNLPKRNFQNTLYCVRPIQSESGHKRKGSLAGARNWSAFVPKAPQNDGASTRNGMLRSPIEHLGVFASLFGQAAF
jgi:hypothetical protein